jgi:lipoprotein-releasing system ATP-binding protein
MSDAVLRARAVDKSYASGARAIDVLRSLDLEIKEGEAVAVVGDSGVGKSTLLHILGGLDRPDSGRIEFRGEPLDDGDVSFMARYRNRHIGFVFQFHHLLPEFTALENVEMPFRIRRHTEDCRERAVGILDHLGLGDRLEHYPGELSGGEQQRVAIARAVVTEPDVVLADEPTGNLDPATGLAVFGTLRGLQERRGFSVVLATHSERLARGCDRILRLEQGCLRALEVEEAREYFDGLARSPRGSPAIP